MKFSRIYVALALLITSVSLACSQTSPGLFNGQVPTAAQWNSYFAAKQDFPVPLFSPTTPGSVPASGGGTTAYLRADSTWAIPAGGGGGTPGGSTTQLQYNNAGVFGGITGATTNGTAVTLTSPTLITPALGTPSALVLTNATGLPVGGLSASGTPSSSNFLRGDNTWATPSGSGNVSGPGSAVSANLASFNGTSGTIIQDSGVATASVVTLTGSQTITNKTLTSPIMTAPALGTPASGVLTNATGLVPSTGLAATGTPSASTFLRGDNTWQTVTGTGTVTSVAQTFTGGLVSVAGSPITGAGTLALTVAGTSGGIPYFSSASTWASSAALAANSLVIGGGAGIAPATTTTGTGILTFLGTPSSANLAAALTNETGSGLAVFGTSPTLITPALGTPTALVLTNATGLVASTGTTATGTPSSSTYLRGDNTWGTPSGSGTVTTLTAGSGVLFSSGSTCTATCTISTTVNINAQATGHALASTEAGQITYSNSGSAVAYSIVQANTAGFTAGAGWEVASLGAGATTITAAGGSLFGNGLGTLVLNKGQYAFFASDSTNYPITAVTLPVMPTNTYLGNTSGTSNYPTTQTFGTGVATALGTAVSGTGALCLATGSACSGGGSQVTPSYIVNNYYGFNALSASGSATVSDSVTTRWYPVTVTKAITISQLCSSITTSVAGNMQFAIATNNASTNLPSTILNSTASISTASTGPICGTLASNVSITTLGVYWVGYQVDNVTARSLAISNVWAGGQYLVGATTLTNFMNTTGNVSQLGWVQTSTFGTWNTTSVTETAMGGTSTMPYVFFKVASVP